MPTLVEIEDADYALFDSLRKILNHPTEGVGFAVHAEYIPDMKLAKFHFADSKYIPPSMWEFAKRIPGNDKRVEACEKKIKEMLTIN